MLNILRLIFYEFCVINYFCVVINHFRVVSNISPIAPCEVILLSPSKDPITYTLALFVIPGLVGAALANTTTSERGLKYWSVLAYWAEWYLIDWFEYWLTRDNAPSCKMLSKDGLLYEDYLSGTWYKGFSNR